MMKKKMMAAGGNMKKKSYAAGGASGMKKKMMSRGGKMPMNPATGKPTFVGDGVGKMAKGGNMKKKMYANRGTDVSSDYTSGSITKRKYPGAGVRRTGTTESKDKAVTPAMIKKAGITGGSAKQRLNAYMNKFKMEGGKYVKRKNILRSSDSKVNEMLGIGAKTIKARGKGTSPTKVVLRGARAVKGPGKRKAGESNFERLLRENRAAIAKSGGKSGRLKKDK